MNVSTTEALFYTPLTIAELGGFKRGSSCDCIKSAVKIDLIVTKSVSRFARHTVDSLTTIRKLKEKGMECFFEKETSGLSMARANCSSPLCPALRRRNPAAFQKTAHEASGSTWLMAGYQYPSTISWVTTGGHTASWLSTRSKPRLCG